MTAFINLLLYQIGWFASVLGSAWNLQWLGVGIAMCLIGIHLRLATDRRTQLKLILVAAAVGLVVDTGQLWAGVFKFPHGVLHSSLPPLFMSVLWMQFATTFRYSMSWLSGRYLLAALFGLFGAPLAFFAGERFGAIEFLAPRAAHFALLGMVWSVCVPLLVYISAKLAANAETKSAYRWSTSEEHS